MADAAFVSADIEKISEFEKKSQEAITEFDAIKNKFNEVNADLVKKWEGEGSDEYKKETEHILENIGGIKDVLDAINNSVVKDIKENYMKLDVELGEYNKSLSSEQ